jgi:hypothetical protein
MNMKSKDTLYEIKEDLISEINLNFSSKQYKLINAVAQAALNILYEEAMVSMSNACKANENSLNDLAHKVEKL